MKNVLVISGIIILILVLGVYWYFQNVITVFTLKEIPSTTLKETIYLKNTKRGLNYDEVVISKSSKRKSNTNKDYIYTWGETLFYKISNDSLYVYCKIKTNVPPNFDSKVKIYQIQYSNPEYYDLIKNYKKKGLDKFPIE